MKVTLYIAVLLALLCVVKTAAEPYKQEVVESVPAATRFNPRFYLRLGRDEQGVLPSEAEDELIDDEELDDSEDMMDDDEDDDEEPIETYYPVSDDNGQTYLIPETAIQVMADKQKINDNSGTYLVPHGSVQLDEDQDDEDEENNPAIILSQASIQNVDGDQYIAIVEDPETYGKSRRIAVRRNGGLRRRRAGGRRNRRRRAGSRQGLRRRRTRKRFQRGGRGGRGRGRRRRAGGRVKLGRIRMRPRGNPYSRFGF